MTAYRERLRRSWELRHQGLGRRLRRPDPAQVLTRPASAAPRGPRGPAERLRRRLFSRMLEEMETRGLSDLNDPAGARETLTGLLDEMDRSGALSDAERSEVISDLVAEICGFGPLDPLFDDPTVSDVLVNGADEVWVDRFGRLERTSVRFEDEGQLLRLLTRLVAAHGRHLDEASPSVDVMLSDGSRLHAMIPPLSRSPVVAIRRMRVVSFRPEELCAVGTLTPELMEFLSSVVGARLNVLISGGAASGKTTLLNVLSGFIPRSERVVTIEETAELRLKHPHVVSLEARLPNVEGRGEVTMRTLVRNALRMRPDRIIVGEVRGPEVFDMLQAMNTGHEGSLTTVHANSPGDALRRLENLVLMGGFGLPSGAIRQLLGATIHVIVHLTRFLDGTRRVTSIREVRLEGDALSTREFFRFEGQGAAGRHVATGERPSFADALEVAARRRAGSPAAGAGGGV